jgi:protein-arginine kinase activator protein McsA
VTDPVYDLICSIGEMIDKLINEDIKCYDSNRRILEERRKERPDPQQISNLEFVARSAGEQRVRLKNELNKRLAEAIRRGGFESAAEVRTYDLKGIDRA